MERALAVIAPLSLLCGDATVEAGSATTTAGVPMAELAASDGEEVVVALGAVGSDSAVAFREAACFFRRSARPIRTSLEI